MRYFLLSLLAFIMLCAPALAAENIQTLEKELQVLEKELPAILKEETVMDTRQDYVNRILDLREKIEALEGNEVINEGHHFKLTRIKSTVKTGEEKNGKATIRRTFDEKTITFTWVKDNTADKYKFIETQSMGFDYYPQKIMLGEPFRFEASSVNQRDIYPGYCWTTDEQSLSSTLEISLGYGYSVAPKKVPYRISDCKRSKSNQTVHVGSKIQIVVQCNPKEVTYYKLYGYLLYEYECKHSTKDEPGKWKKTPTREFKIDIKRDANDDPIKDENGHYILNQKPIPSQGSYDVGLGVNHQYRTNTIPLDLVYEPVYSDVEMLEGTGTVQHPIEPNNSVEEGGESEGEEAEERTQDTAEKDESRSNSRDEQETSAQTAAGQREQAAKDARRPHIEHWLANADPLENAQPGYDLKYDKWGSVSGKTPNGTITLSGKPADAGADSPDYVWARANIMSSLNLCTLKEYVTRKLADTETASCRMTIPTPVPEKNAVPDLVGTQATKAKAQLIDMGVKIKWKAGSMPKNAAQTGTVEKQKPAPGTDLKKVKQVELWVFRGSAKTVKVPDVTGLPYGDAVAKLKQAGLIAKIGMKSIPRSRDENGRVSYQSVPRGETVASGATVTLNIYGSAGQARVPDVRGKSYENAVKILSEKGLKPKRRIGPYANIETLAHTVKKTIPSIGTRLDLGAYVTVVVYNKYKSIPLSSGLTKVKPQVLKDPDPPQARGNSETEFKCDARIASLPVDPIKTHWSYGKDKSKEGTTYIASGGAKVYGCKYTNYRSVTIEFFTKYQSDPYKKRAMAKVCAGDISRRYGGGKAVNIFIDLDKSMASIMGQDNADKLIKFHIQQILPYAVPCNRSPSGAPGAQRNRGGQGYGGYTFNCADVPNFCRWEGESQGMYGVPGLGGGGYRRCVCGCNKAPANRCKN
jgi:beta-lactam-binding protein with PASTA domain